MIACFRSAWRLPIAPMTDCPSCSANNTLVLAGKPDARGLTLAICSCCGKSCRVNRAGEVVKPEPLVDISHRPMTDP